jgi:hypothetical protein
MLMNDKILFPGLVAASLVAAFTLAPLLAYSTTFLDVNQSNVFFKPSGSMAATFATAANIPKNGLSGAFGYGVVTSDGDSLAVMTTHAGVYDSILQKNAADPRWHNHMVKLVDGSGDGCAANTALGGARLKVGEISFQSPGGTTVVGPNAGFSNIPAKLTGIDSLTGNAATFSRGSDVVAGGSFELRVAAPGVICVENVSPAAVTNTIP